MSDYITPQTEHTKKERARLLEELEAAKEAARNGVCDNVDSDATWDAAKDVVLTEYGILTKQPEASNEELSIPTTETAALLVLAMSNVALTAEMRRFRWHTVEVSQWGELGA